MENNNSLLPILIPLVILVLIIIFFKDIFIYPLIGAAVIAAVIITLVIISKVKKKKENNTIVIDSITKGAVNLFMKESKARIQNVNKYYYKLKDEETQKTLEIVCSKLKKIINMVVDDPKDYVKVRRFLLLILNSLEIIVEQSSLIYAGELNEKSSIAL